MKKKQKKAVAGAVCAAVLPCIILIAMAVGCLILGKILALRAVSIVFTLIYSATAVGILFALRQRIKEIKGGEEDEASYY